MFDPVLHMSQHLEVKGEFSRESQSLSFVMTTDHAPEGTVHMRPAPLELTLENRSNVRTLPAVWVVSDKVHDFINKRRPYLTAKRLLTNQTFRDIYRTDALDVDQGSRLPVSPFCLPTSKGQRNFTNELAIWLPTIWCARTFGSCMKSWLRKGVAW